MEFERAFVKAGGTLLAGLDPTGMGGVVAGFGDQRELELLVEAGFTPLEAIHIATYNGAQYLGELDKIGTIAAGKQADLVVIKGDPSQKIEDIENVEIVFKDGVGYDSAKLIESVKGIVQIARDRLGSFELLSDEVANGLFRRRLERAVHIDRYAADRREAADAQTLGRCGLGRKQHKQCRQQARAHGNLRPNMNRHDEAPPTRAWAHIRP